MGNGAAAKMLARACTVAFWPRFQVGARTVHCNLRSVPVRAQKKLSQGFPPQSAKVSICILPGLALPVKMVSPERQGDMALTGLLMFLPERLLAFVQPSFLRGSFLRIRVMVLALILRSSLSVSGLMQATCPE